MSAITSTPVVLSARARVAGSAVRAAAPARVAPARRVQVVCAAKKGAFADRPFSSRPSLLSRPSAEPPLVAGGDPTDACGVGSTVARRAFVAGVAARSARVFGDSRVGSVAPEPARLAAVELQAPRLSNQHLTC